LKKIAVGNKSLNKVKAIKKVFGEDVQVKAFHVYSGVQRDALDVSQIRLGAKNRAEGVKKIADKKGETFDLYIGIESGFEKNGDAVKVKDSVYMINSRGERAEASSHGKRLPKMIGEMLYGGENVRSAVMKVYPPKDNKDNQKAIRYFNAVTLGHEEAIGNATNNAMVSMKNNENKMSLIMNAKKQRA
jgi:non-canonical (house-cleaning) NTP pyrophosphatase